MTQANKKTWEFSALDTLFFRESRPMEAPGSSELSSVFPPPARTLAGAIRSHIGESMDVDWQVFKQAGESQQAHPLKDIIGYGDDFAEQFQLQGVWIHYKGERLYPAPLNLIVLRKGKAHRNKMTHIAFLQVGEACECDLGKNVALPCLPENMERSKALSSYWLNRAGLQKVLIGEKPDTESDIIPIHKLRKEERRLGIARDNQQRSVIEGKLYQTRHIRLTQPTCISVDLIGLKTELRHGLLKLGGEGRMAHLQQCNQPIPFPQAPNATAVKNASACGIVLYLLTPMLIDDDSEFLPNFHKQEDADDKRTLWQGSLHNTSLKLISSVTGKVQREGGWDVAKHQPRPVHSLTPAGSVFYCEVENNTIQQAIDDLHSKQIGLEQHLGRGQLAVGLWLSAATKGQTA